MRKYIIVRRENKNNIIYVINNIRINKNIQKRLPPCYRSFKSKQINRPKVKVVTDPINNPQLQYITLVFG